MQQRKTIAARAGLPAEDFPALPRFEKVPFADVEAAGEGVEAVGAMFDDADLVVQPLGDLPVIYGCS